MPDLSHTIAFNAVVGAVRNVLDGHPKWIVPQNFARSVAKRAAGTLMAHAGPSLLASARRSGQRQRLQATSAASGGGALSQGRLLSRIHGELTTAAAVAHKAKDDERFFALVTAMRIIKREIQREAESNAG